MVVVSEFIQNYNMPMDIQVSADILEKKISFKPRGAPLGDKERKELNLKAGRLIKSLGISIAITETNLMCYEKNLDMLDMHIIT